MRKRVLLSMAAGLALTATAVNAQESAVGVAAVDVPAQTDTRVSLPVTRQAVGTFAVAPSGVSGDTVTLDGASFATDAFPLNSQDRPLYYVRFTSGALEGMWFNVASHTSNSLTLVVEDTEVAADLSSAAEGDELTIIPHWTIETIFPPELEGLSFDASPSFFQPGFRVVVPNNSDVGTNRSSVDALIFIEAQQEWRNLSNQPRGDLVVGPQRTLTLRNTNPVSTGEEDDPGTLADESSGNRQFLMLGVQNAVKVIERVPYDNGAVDVIVSANNLFPVKLSEANLDQVLNDSGAFFTPKDRLVLFPEAQADGGFNPSSEEAVIRVGDNYVNLSNQNRNDRELQPGEVFIIRQQDAGAAGEDVWTVQP